MNHVRALPHYPRILGNSNTVDSYANFFRLPRGEDSLSTVDRLDGHVHTVYKSLMNNDPSDAACIWESIVSSRSS